MHRNEPAPLDTVEAIAGAARRLLGAHREVHFAPSIPRAKQQGARLVHALHLPESEPIAVLHDATIFGGAENGFLITPERFCWKNLWEHPRQITWADLDPASIRAGSGRVQLARGALSVSGEIALPLSALLAEIASRRRAPASGPYRSAEPGALPEPGATLALRRVVAVAREHLGEVSDVYYPPAIPPAKLRNARVVHAEHLPGDEAVAVLYDDTVFGSAENGFLITARRLCWKSLAEAPRHLEWQHLGPGAIGARGNVVRVAGGAIHLTARSELAAPVAKLLAALAAEARRAGDRG